jgi:hypothetical protein
MPLSIGVMADQGFLPTVSSVGYIGVARYGHPLGSRMAADSASDVWASLDRDRGYRPTTAGRGPFGRLYPCGNHNSVDPNSRIGYARAQESRGTIRNEGTTPTFPCLVPQSTPK